MKCSEVEALVGHLRLVLAGLKGADKGNPRCEELARQEVQVLLTLGGGPAAMSEIAEAIGLCLSSVTGLVDRLEGRKLVRRIRSAADRRVVQAELTEEGVRVYKGALEGHVEFARRLLEALDADEQKQLARLMAKVAGAMRQEEAAA